MRSIAADVNSFRSLPTYLKLIIVTPFVFNCGFYLVVPFLATHMKEDLAFGGLLIGIVLGVRTFAQQGMFFVGGVLSDHIGIKPAILVGCLVRVLGFVLLGLSEGPVGMIAGAIATGFAGALFTPAVESAISTWGLAEEEKGGLNRKEVWGLHGVLSQMGSVVGPGLGAALIAVPFSYVCIIAAVIFLVMFVVLALNLPSTGEGIELHNPKDSIRAVMANKSFLVFTVINASYLVTYNQLYLALPADIERQGAAGGTISWYFMMASIISIFGQMPLTRLSMRLGRRASLIRGYIIMAAGFIPLLLVSPFAGSGEWFQTIPAIVMVITLHIGFMISSPVTRDFVGVLARERHMATHMGMVGTMGGIGVLISSTITGWLLELTTDPSLMSTIPWAVCMAFPLVSAIAIAKFPFPTSKPTFPITEESASSSSTQAESVNQLIEGNKEDPAPQPAKP